MNQGRAKAIRKSLGFKTTDDRTYIKTPFHKSKSGAIKGGNVFSNVERQRYQKAKTEYKNK